ncbi:PREDICTED: dynamin-related protein 5A [Nicotiana attenuata]|uniref:Dynamin-related protein 5a n=1 Tax=Nicotiana attenuata TaxID=49451 RepID=A0A1J6I6S7_NICAT|nr:PREDICTED: dynamin-related protein 5A [Nicotiana attenuata]OIT00718.1 dynamin-related protein 5a [Nicotiana attenuata]
MSTTNTFLNTPTKTPNSTSISKKHHKQHASDSGSEFKDRFEAYNRLQAAAVAFGEKLPIPEIVAIGGQSDGKSSLLEALLGFRFNVREVEMGTRRPLILQMVHDPTALEPRCSFQEEDSEEYGSPIVLASAIADTIKFRTESLLKRTRAAVSSKPIVMRAEYAHCPNLTIIDTPGFVLKAKKGEPERTPDEILSMVKSLASPPHRIILFLQQSSVEWCSSLWLDTIREIDPTFRRTVIVVSKFDNRLKEFTDRWEVDRYLSASGYLGENTRPFFVALPKDRGTISNDEFRRQISQVDAEMLHYLRDSVKGGFDEDKYRSSIGFGCLRDYLEAELQRRYKEATPATLALLEQRCGEVTAEIARTECKIKATSDVAHLRKSAMLHTAALCNHVEALIDGAADPAPEQWGKTTEEERSESGIGSWPSVTVDIKPPNATLRLYGGAAFERVMHEFRCATYSIKCPPVSREKVANILLAHTGRGGGRGIAEAAAEIARAAARSWLAPLLDTACDRLAFVLGYLFEISIEKNHGHDSNHRHRSVDMDGYVGFHAALRQSYNHFIKDLSKECKQLLRHHLDSVTSPYSHVCYDNNFIGSFSSGASSMYQFNQASTGPLCLDLSDGGPALRKEVMKDQENIPPEKNAQETTPGKVTENREALRECQMTVPETPSPDQPSDGNYGIKRELVNCVDVGARKRHPRIAGNARNCGQNGESLLFGNGDNISRPSSTYAEICSSAAQHFARIREVLVERSVASTLNSGFLTPCRERLLVALGLDLFAVNDEQFMDMFVAPGAIDTLENERQSLQKRQKILHSCLNEFKSVARAL